ncbi:ADP-ribose pyrophosphatase YjhB, NUDIX family [Verrucomicrobium sp. GAS474]|uniref:NUDIX hydrolase n=1 Tax=Verrucomicrobium sp. GAS474 TaxID=1882831 RepID=UPI00087AAECF|nr:NUDIX hydrolase [Verrucomicrobium sp. GAS474]SDT93411.1 ADP-ribose pyrophosphatase YjhB, NUDIX family [Verrucomicrobium sp. GAS474]
MARTLLEISRELAAISQAGLAYSRDFHDRERFEQLRGLASELVQALPGKADFAWPSGEGYPTPKVDVRALVIRGGEILLVRERATGRWSAPGGWADVNLTPAENARKECREEAGIEIEVEQLSAVLDRDRAGHLPIAWSVYKLYFLCHPLDDTPVAAGPEVLDARYFRREALPDDLDLERITAEEIERGFRLREEGSIPTFFQS